MRSRLRFLGRKKKEVIEAEKPRHGEEPKKEFPAIAKEAQRKYIGKHVVIVDGKIATAARSAKQALAKVKKKYPKEKIILRYVANENVFLKCKCLG